MGEQASGEVGIDMEPLFLEWVEALKWPHFGHTYSVNAKGRKQSGCLPYPINAVYMVSVIRFPSLYGHCSALWGTVTG